VSTPDLERAVLENARIPLHGDFKEASRHSWKKTQTHLERRVMTTLVADGISRRASPRRYAETDQMGVVYYGNYFVWFEIGRVELMRALGFEYKLMETEDDCFFIVGGRSQLPLPAVRKIR